MKIIAIVQTRTNSSRFPEKVLQRTLDEPMFLKCVTRLKRSSKLTEIVVATSTSPSDDIIADLCKERKIACFRGSEKDVLDRYYKTALAFKADAVVRITSDCPLIDPLLVDIGISEFIKADKLDYLSNTFPRRTFPRGLDFEVISFNCLEVAHLNDSDLNKREHVSPFIMLNMDRFRAMNIVSNEDYSKFRVTVDEPADLQVVNKIFEFFGHDLFTWYEIVSVLLENPWLCMVNLKVVQRCFKWEENYKNDGVIEKVIEYERFSPKMVLGTAQLGLDYGITNKVGKPDYDTALEMVKKAWVSGIRSFDTAQAYGESERILGSCLRQLGVSKEARIITKLDPKLDHLDKKAVKKAVKNSLDLLGVGRLYAVLIHNENLIEEMSNGLYENLLELKDDGYTSHLGVSCYEPEKALKALKYDQIDVVQFPANVFDSRFRGLFTQNSIQEKEVHVYIRSIFLQGVLLCKVDDIPKPLKKFLSLFIKYDNILCKYKIDKLSVALNYIMQKFPHAQIIFGVDHPKQLETIVENINCKLPEQLVKELDAFSLQIPEELLKPFLWGK